MPVQPPIMMLGGAATLLQMLANALATVPLLLPLIGALAQVLAWGVYVFLQYTILVVQATAAIPFGSFEVARIAAPLVILFYGALFGVTYLGIKRTGQRLVSRVWIGLAVLALATMFVWTTALASPDPRTRVSFLTAGEGDATFIRTGEDYRILINGTGEPNTLLSFPGNQFPPWDRRIDLVVATPSANDNLSSLNAVLFGVTYPRIKRMGQVSPETVVLFVGRRPQEKPTAEILKWNHSGSVTMFRMLPRTPPTPRLNCRSCG